MLITWNKKSIFAQCFCSFKAKSLFTGHRTDAASTPHSHQGAPPLGNFTPPKHKHNIYFTLYTLMWSSLLIMFCVFTYWKDPKYGEPINGQSRQFYRSGASTPPWGGVESAAFHKGSSWGKHEKPFITQFTRADNITHTHARTQGQTRGVLDRCERANPLLFPRALKGVYRLLRPREAGPLRGTRLRGEFSPHGWVWPNICKAEVLTTGHMSNRKTNMRGPSK